MKNSPIKPSTGQTIRDYSLDREVYIAQCRAFIEEIYVETPFHEKLNRELHATRMLGLQMKNSSHRALRCIAPSSAGKSTVAKRYRDKLKLESSDPDNYIQVLYVSIQNSSTPKLLIQKILEELGDIGAGVGTEARMKMRLVKLLEYYRVELLILDEIHHLNRGHAAAINLLKSFLNDGICPLALFGTEEALPLFRDGSELNQRTATIADMHSLPNSDKGIAITKHFLVNFDTKLRESGIFSNASAFIHDDVVLKMQIASGGYLGRAARLIQAAATNALRRHAKMIEVYDLSLAMDEWMIPHFFAKTNCFIER